MKIAATYSKTLALIIRPHMLNIMPNMFINKINLEYTTEVKFLGIYITETLKWDTHIQILANKLSEVSFMAKSLKGILSPYMIRNIYFTKIQALLRFGILFLGGKR